VAAGLDDATLVARARDGDVRAFEALVLRYQTPLFRLAARMLDDRWEAEDVVQEVFVTAWRRLPGLHDAGAVGGWLFRSVTNRCLSVLRTRRYGTDVDVTAVPDVSPAAAPGRAAESGAAMDALRAALRRLTPEQRAAWLLREVHERSYAEIAEVLGTTPTAVRGRIARARADLAEAMQQWR
jgi:RNA polymerase sigma-70 factor (ECF subfamily)